MLRNCRICEELFHSEINSICQTCTEIEVKSLKQIHEHLKIHPNTSMIDLVRELEIDSKVLSHMIQSGKLKIG